MARIKIPLPDEFVFAIEVRVRISDINYGGHLGNDAVLSLLHEARLQFLRANGYSEMDVEGVGIIMSDAAVVYKSQAFHGDVLKVQVAVQDFNPRGCDLVYRVTQSDGGREVARAKTGIVFFDYGTGRVASLPEAFRKRMES